MKYTIIDSATHTIINAKSKKGLFNEIKDSTPFFRNQTDKQFMEGYSIRRQLLGLSSLDTTSVEKFIDSMIKNQLIVKGVMTEKTAISKFSARNTKGSTQKKKIGSTDSVLTLSKIKDFVDTLGQIKGDLPNRRNKIQKFIERNSPSVKAEDIPNGSTIWIFSGAPQYYIGRAKLLSKSPSKSDKMITLYLTDDTKYEDWRKQDSYASSIKEFDQISISAMRVEPKKYYKSVKRDKEIPLG